MVPALLGLGARGMRISRIQISTVPANQDGLVTQGLSFGVGGKGAPRQADWADTWGQIRLGTVLLDQPGSPQGEGVVLLFLMGHHLLHDVSSYGVTSTGLAQCRGRFQGSGKK